MGGEPGQSAPPRHTHSATLSAREEDGWGPLDSGAYAAVRPSADAESVDAVPQAAILVFWLVARHKQTPMPPKTVRARQASARALRSAAHAD